MRVAGMMRIRNEGRWIRAVVRSILPLCERVLILDDHSVDGTPEICRSLGERVVVIPSPFDGLDESRDKNYLLAEIGKLGADWCLCIDGDEILEADGTRRILAALESARQDCYALQVVFLWNGPGTVRVDGVYGDFSRPSLFRLGTGATFPTTGCGGHFHCGNVPAGLGAGHSIGARLYHLGYMRRADRLAKYDWYVATDPGNELEDGYRHMVQGDLPEVPAHVTTRHAGPLRLAPIR